MKKKILVVDNNALILAFMSDLLENKGYEVLTAEDGLSALEISATYIPDVMFIDLVMPKINGEQLCRIIKKIPHLKNAYIVILSAALTEKSENYFELDADAYIAKGPFSIMAENVLAAIEQSDRKDRNADPEQVLVFKGIYERDITKELLSNQRHLEAIISNMSEGVIELSPEGKIIFANPAAISLIGLHEEVLLSSKFTGLIGKTDRKRIEDFFISPEKDSQTAGLNSPFLINNRKISITILPVKDSLSPSFLLVLDDITETIQAEAILKRKQEELERLVYERTMELEKSNKLLQREIRKRVKAEKILKASERKYRLLFENANDAIFILQNNEIQFSNPKTLELTGFNEEELRKIPFTDLIHREDRLEVIAKFNLGPSTKAYPQTNFSFRAINKAGKELLIEVSVVTVTWEDDPATLIFARDISQQKQMERQLQQSQKMEAIGTLAGGIAHDFNNLLTAIQGRTSIMLMDKGSSHPDFVHLAGIEDCIGSAIGLTKQLLGFARGGKYEIKPTDLNELIRKENRMFGRTKKEITIRENYEENLWPVEIDRGQIQQVLLNLYVNAWQAMPAGGGLHIRTQNVTLNEIDTKPHQVEPGRYVQTSVTDTGIGIDNAIRERIFDPFFTTKSPSRGTGLGLASAYGIINNHGGFINVYSEKGHGSTFNFYLPASEKRVIVEKKPAGVTLMGSETVLFVDDEIMIIEIAEEMLTRLGYKVLTATSGKEAVEIFREHKDRIDLVILDMIMPHMSGGVTYDRIKEISPKLKVLLSSGYSIDGQATEILDRGCNGFIQKPFKLKELSQKLRDILDENSA